MRFDAVVIGAGPAGSVAARLLAKSGWSVALVEKAPFPRRKVCGEFISAATLPLLDECGVGNFFVTMAGPKISRVALYAGASISEAPLPSGGGRALGREHLDTLLRDAAIAAGAQIFQPNEPRALRRIARGHIVELDGVTLEARIVIAAGGSWTSKGPLAVHASPRRGDLFAFKAHFLNSKLPEGLMPLLAFPGGYGGMVHSDKGRVSLSCCIRRDALIKARGRYPGRAAEATFAHIKQTNAGAAQALSGATLDAAPLASGPIRPGIRTRYKDGIFYTGNLAGEAHPVIAEGISMAIQSSSLLARILLANPDMDKAGGRYSRAWLAHFAPRLYASKLFAHMAMHKPTRALAAGITATTPSLLTWGARLAGKAA